jgi:hypothetical protein
VHEVGWCQHHGMSPKCGLSEPVAEKAWSTGELLQVQRSDSKGCIQSCSTTGGQSRPLQGCRGRQRFTCRCLLNGARGVGCCAGRATP